MEDTKILGTSNQRRSWRSDKRD